MKLVLDDGRDNAACPEITSDYAASLLDAVMDAAEERGIEWP